MSVLPNCLTLLHEKLKNETIMSKKGSITTADYLQYGEFQRLIQCLINDKQYLWATYCSLSFCLGLRSSDVRKLRWDNVLDTDVVSVVEKKTGKSRQIPLGMKTAAFINQMYKSLGKPKTDKFIFVMPNRYSDKPVSIQYINRLAKDWKTKYHLNIHNISTHTFRKTFGRYYWEKSGRSEQALIELNRVFRHASIQTTMIYIGITNDNICNIFKSIEF